MFSGFTDETFNFFAAIRFNNNREFFHENHDWYVRAVREPARELAGALGDAVLSLDPTLETRPQKVVSRINRDLRFTNDKSPYRDYLWLGFHRPGAEKHATLGAYFDISDDGASFGVGIYDENRPLMNGLRRRVLFDAETLLPLVMAAETDFTLHGDAFKRRSIPETVPEPLKKWYPLRGFYLEREINDFDLLRSARLVEYIAQGYAALKPIYSYIAAIPPETEDISEAKEALKP